jgi:hypothetical protein
MGFDFSCLKCKYAPVVHKNITRPCGECWFGDKFTKGELIDITRDDRLMLDEMLSMEGQPITKWCEENGVNVNTVYLNFVPIISLHICFSNPCL